VASRLCIVSFTDADGLRHSVEVSAGTLYEAAALGLQAFRKSDLTEKIGMGAAKVLTVEAKAETETHQVRLERLLGWLESNGRTPKEQAVKRRLRARSKGLSPAEPIKERQRRRDKPHRSARASAASFPTSRSQLRTTWIGSACCCVSSSTVAGMRWPSAVTS